MSINQSIDQAIQKLETELQALKQAKAILEKVFHPTQLEASPIPNVVHELGPWSPTTDRVITHPILRDEGPWRSNSQPLAAGTVAQRFRGLSMEDCAATLLYENPHGLSSYRLLKLMLDEGYYNRSGIQRIRPLTKSLHHHLVGNTARFLYKNKRFYLVRQEAAEEK